jgi:3-oxoacyl-[acyl-carrier protein] reductase
MTARSAKTALVTNATGFAGPPAVSALLAAGFRVIAHDRTFDAPQAASAFVDDRPGLEPIAGSEPEAVAREAIERAGVLAAIVSNDHFPAPALPPETAPVEGLRDNYAHLVEFPFRLIQALLPTLRRQSGANLVMITSNRTRLPLSGGAFPDAARAAANAMVRSLAIDCANDGIIINAIAPNFLYSEAYFPSALFRETERGRTYVRQSVPVGRLAEPDEIGEVISFLATVKTRFLTGAILDFSGGWPFAPARPSAAERAD